MSHPLPSSPATPPPAAPQSKIPASKAARRPTVNLQLVRLIWAALMLLGLVTTSIVFSPSGESSKWSDEVSAAATKYALQENNAQGAPQQAVLNGWYTNDLLEVQAKIAGDQKEQTDRISAMVFYLGLGILGDLVLRRWGSFRERRKTQP